MTTLIKDISRHSYLDLDLTPSIGQLEWIFKPALKAGGIEAIYVQPRNPHMGFCLNKYKDLLMAQKELAGLVSYHCTKRLSWNLWLWEDFQLFLDQSCSRVWGDFMSPSPAFRERKSADMIKVDCSKSKRFVPLETILESFAGLLVFDKDLC